MKILAIDTASTAASAAVCEDEKLLASYTVRNGNTHSENILPMVVSLLGQLHLSADDIDLFAVTAGPGSFTGVRIGVATLKGLAAGKGKPCVGVSTLEALAYALIGFDGIVCPVMNARREQVYTATFSCRNGRLTRRSPDRALALSALADELRDLDGPIRFVGDGYDLARRAITNNVCPTPDALTLPDAYGVARLGLSAYREGRATTDEALQPVYLRASQAERERLEKLQNSSK